MKGEVCVNSGGTQGKLVEQESDASQSLQSKHDGHGCLVFLFHVLVWSNPDMDFLTNFYYIMFNKYISIGCK